MSELYNLYIQKSDERVLVEFEVFTDITSVTIFIPDTTGKRPDKWQQIATDMMVDMDNSRTIYKKFLSDGFIKIPLGYGVIDAETHWMCNAMDKSIL